MRTAFVVAGLSALFVSTVSQEWKSLGLIVLPVWVCIVLGTKAPAPLADTTNATQ